MKDEEILKEAREMLEVLEDFLDEMTPKEKEFIEDMADIFDRPEPHISERQLRWLRDLADKY